MRAKSAMRAQRNALFWLAMVTALTLSAADIGLAQNRWARGPSSAPNPWARGPSLNSGAGYSGGNIAAQPGVIVAIPSMVPCGGQYTDNGMIPDGLRDPRWPSKRLTRRGPTGGARRLVPDEPMPRYCVGYRTPKGSAARAN